MFLPSLLLLVLVLVLPVGAPCPTPDQKCSAADLAVKHGDVSVTFLSKQTATDNISWNMYVRPDDNFQGVTLLVQGSQGKHGVWFAIPNQCFPDKAWWWEMNVGVMLQKRSIPFDAIFVVRLDRCSMSCTMNTLDVGFYKLEVTAHGPSSWRMKAPNASCTTVRVPSKSKINVSDCQAPPVPKLTEMCPTITEELKPPTPSTISTPATRSATALSSSYKSLVIVVVVVVMLLGVVVAVTVAVKVRTSLAQRTPGQTTPAAPSTATSQPAAPRRPSAPPPPVPPAAPTNWHQRAPRGWPTAAPNGLHGAHSLARLQQDQEEDVYEEIYVNAA